MAFRLDPRLQTYRRNAASDAMGQKLTFVFRVGWRRPTDNLVDPTVSSGLDWPS